MDNESEFVEAMRSLYPAADDFLEALVFAMESVSRTPKHDKNRIEARYFGPIAGGVFYADSEFEHTRWYSDTTPVEAIGLLAAEFGDEWTEGIEAFRPEMD